MVKKTKDVTYYEGIGRRKESVARVRLYIMAKGKDVTIKGVKVAKGQININGKEFEAAYPHDFEKQRILKPLRIAEADDRFAITIKVTGGGRNGQIDAISHGISRALCIVDKDTYKPILKVEGLLTRDPRARQRRMVGKGGKSRRGKQSPKR